MKTEPVMDSSDDAGVELRSTLIKTEDIEESIERKNGCSLSREEELVLSSVKEEEEEEGGERLSKEVKREDGVKDEDVSGFEWKQENKGGEWREGGALMQPMDRGHGNGRPGLSSRKGNSGESEVFTCSQCPFVHMEEEKLQQHVEKVHPEEPSRILRSGGKGAENPLPPSSTHQHPTPPKTLPTPTPSYTGIPRPHICSYCGKSFRSKSHLTAHERIHTGERPYPCPQCAKSFTSKYNLTVHKNTHKREHLYCCSCGRSFRPSRRPKQNQTPETEKHLQRCAECARSVRRLNGPKLRRLTGNGGSAHRCSKCAKSFGSAELLLWHQQTYSGGLSPFCPRCGEGVGPASGLAAPLQTKSRKSLFSCSRCGANFRQQEPNRVTAPQEKICSRHDKLREVYCRTDQQCICMLCVMDEHRGHDTVSAAAERTEKQMLLWVTQGKFQQRIQAREKELQDLRQAVQSLKRSAQAAVEDSEKIFIELIRFIERRCSEVKQLIRDQEKAEVSRAEGLLERLEQEVAELRRRDNELEHLAHTEDHINFLQSCQSLCAPSDPGDLTNITVSPHVSFEALKKSVSKLKERLEDVWKGEFVKISQAVKIPILEPRIREDFLQYSCQLTLDPNTVYRKLNLSEGNREVTRVENSQSHPDHPERFDGWAQVLCREGLSGRCYWEAEWSGDDYVSIAVSYKEISRKGWEDVCGLGRNNKSWSLCCAPSRFYFWHNNKSSKIPVPSSSRIGVYLDHRAGTLSFYSVSDTMTLLLSVQTTFSQPLYPGFGVYCVGSSVKLCDLEGRE